MDRTIFLQLSTETVAFADLNASTRVAGGSTLPSGSPEMTAPEFHPARRFITTEAGRIAFVDSGKGNVPGGSGIRGQKPDSREGNEASSFRKHQECLSRRRDDMPRVQERNGSRKIFYRVSPWILPLLLIGLLQRKIRADSAPVAPPRTTLVFFAGREVSDTLWSALFAALQQDLAAHDGDLSAAALLDPEPRMVAGSELVPGNVVQRVVVIQLKGRCDLLPQAALPMHPGPLGWVTKNRGNIAPFINIDCTRLAQTLNAVAMAMGTDQRRQAMCQAISHVLIHEWVHIVTQSSMHSSRGVEKATLTSSELIAAPMLPAAQSPRTPDIGVQRRSGAIPKRALLF
jgi:hypothetical protein